MGMFDWIFAFFHLLLFIGIISYGVYSLVTGNFLRSAVIMLMMIVYYFLVLHKGVKKEIERKKKPQGK